MAEKKKLTDVMAYLLDEESAKPVQEWLAKAAVEEPDGFQAQLVQCDRREAVARAAFAGVPFVLAGSAPSIEKCFELSSESARRVITDCAYFWTLSDTDQVVSAVAGIAKAHERTVALSWNDAYYNHLLSPLRLLKKCEAFAGLSISTHRTREEIGRIANADHGAFSPVLILGDPGSGKELIARELWNAYCARGKARDRAPMTEPDPGYSFNLARDGQASIACGWLGEHLLQDQLFGHQKGAFTGADQEQKGLLETLKDGCIFLDDFDVAPADTQGALLRVMSTDWGKAASFHRLGGVHVVETNAWLLFATNADIQKKIEAKEIRPDFIYRFEDRVIHLRPLVDRPADIPQIALKLWWTIWRGRKDPLELGPPHIELLMSPAIKWPGNVRQLRALLSLAASRQRLTRKPLRILIAEILALGDYNRWVGIVLDRENPARPAGPEPPACLSEEGALAFRKICEDLRLTPRGKAKTDNRVRLARIIEYVFANGSITATVAQKLNSGSPATGPVDLKTLAGARQKPALLESGDNGKTYTPVPAMFSLVRESLGSHS